MAYSQLLSVHIKIAHHHHHICGHWAMALLSFGHSIGINAAFNPTTIVVTCISVLKRALYAWY